MKWTEKARKTLEEIQEIHVGKDCIFEDGAICVHCDRAWPCPTRLLADEALQQEDCFECGGTGDVEVLFAHGVQMQDCPFCNGIGFE